MTGAGYTRDRNTRDQRPLPRVAADRRLLAAAW